MFIQRYNSTVVSMASNMAMKKNQVKLSEYDSNIEYPKGTEFVWDDELDMSKIND